MLKLVVDGNWFYCAVIAASQLVGGCFRIHHEDFLGAGVQMLSGIGCLFALRRFRVSFVRKLLVPMVLISLAYEFSQLQTAICYGANVRSFKRLFWNCATLWSCVASFWFLQLWSVLLDAEIAKAKVAQDNAAKATKEIKKASPAKEAGEIPPQDAKDGETDKKEESPVMDLLNSVPERDDADFFVTSEAEGNEEPLLLSFG